MKKMMERFKNERGLTLVELLAVVVILAIVGTIAFVMIGNVIENSKKDAHVANAQQLIASAKLYEANMGQLNEGTGDDEGNYVVESSELQDEGYIEDLVNPWTKEIETDYVGSVTKDKNGKYAVTLKGGNSCDIEATEEQVLKGRSEVCKE